MASNIKIVGEILNTQQLSRYDSSDLNLLPSSLLKENFGEQNDYIEYFVYDAGGNLLNINYDYKNFKLPTTSYIDPTKESLPIIEIDPIKDLQNIDYSSGEFIVSYNFFSNLISDPIERGLFIKEISADRTEIRVGSTVLSNEQIEKDVINIVDKINNSTYFVDFILNFDNNTQALAVNIALNKIESGYEVLFKLYQPLSSNIIEKTTLWVVEEKVNPYSFNINLDKFIIPDSGPLLRGPNFNIDIPNKNNIGTSYQTYTNLLDNLSISSSYQQLLSLITSQSIDINIDYSNFSNFTFFGSAKQRVVNFYNKVKEIEDLKTNITAYTALTSSRPNLTYDLNLATSSLNNTISNFDGFEYYLYFESGSLTSSADYGITPYPKSTSTLPHTLYSTGSASSLLWLSYATASAEEYDDYNQNNLEYTVPGFIRDNEDNSLYLTFLNMIGHYFDNIWIFLQAITDINLANNNLEQGISKDLVYNTLQSLGINLYNKYGDEPNNNFLIGNNSGSANFDNNFTPTGSYLNNIPRKDLLAETYKRIYHNLPLLLKTKGTTYGLQTLISTFGVTSSILGVKEYGGDLKSNTLDEFNDDKVRIISSNIVTGSVLSPYISLEQYPTSSTQFRSNDLHYVDISFSPETQIDTYASASIAAISSSWSIDDYVGDPGYSYSSSYDALNSLKNTHYNFTASRMDYAGFIRLIQFFDNSLFKMLKDYVPAKVNLSTGVTINSPVLERNKWSYSNPSNTSKITINEGTIEGPTIGTEYTTLFTYLSGSKLAYYNGEIPGDTVNYNDIFNEYNNNPYLTFNTEAWNNTYPSNSINLNTFNHSNFNILLNNVTSSLISKNRQNIEYIFGTTESILSPVQLQDSYNDLKTHLLSRYEGTKISSLLYNTYSSASDSYIGDLSYGKTAVIDLNSRKLGLFTNIVSSSYLPGRNKVDLKYLVDEFGGLTELNQRNKHWEEVQNIFVAGNYLNVSQFDNQKFGNQKTTDGNKLIFESGYSYFPILYFATCSSDPKIYFENLGGSSAYRSRASNTTGYISGSTPLTHPLSGSSSPNKYVMNLFDNISEGSTYFFGGNTTNFPSYSVQESGPHSIQATFDLTLTLPTIPPSSASWALEVYVDGVLQSSYTDKKTFEAGDPPAATLTFSSYGAGEFYFSLNTPINSIDIDITYAGVNGYSTTDCSGGVIESDSLSISNYATIPAGQYFATKIGSYNLTSASKRYKQIDSLTVNGNSGLVNGSTVVIGGTTVTISIPNTTNCRPYYQ